ncbi:hypothetical protein FB472_1198 [Rhodoglobus vestalii]|uniref:Uncharacterized protein n=1 Tax=Rhodoglobus vestalii TaxID=193384 RepID=A0A8H2PXU2_9MICO|nr:hypothetical protein FB472_1198 [Rhodoglobus vestalii]
MLISLATEREVVADVTEIRFSSAVKRVCRKVRSPNQPNFQQSQIRYLP